MAQHHVAIVVPAEFELFELGVAVEAFALPRPELGRDWYDARVCTAHPGPATAIGGLFGATIRHGVEAMDWADTIIVPEADPYGQAAEPEVIDALRRAHGRGARLVSFCTGVFALAAAGVLDGRRATTHWQHTRRLAQRYPGIRVDADVLYIDDGQVLTSAGTAAGIDLSLHIIRSDFGAQVARHIARVMVVAPHRDGGQAQFVISPVPDIEHEGDGISRVMEHVVEHLDQEFSLAEMAGLAYMSTRNFSRRFREVAGTTPMRWLLHQRLARVRELLEETDLPIDRIVGETGFGSAVTLRQRFAKHLLTSPTAYRRAFRAGLGERAPLSAVGVVADPSVSELPQAG